MPVEIDFLADLRSESGVCAEGRRSRVLGRVGADVEVLADRDAGTGVEFRFLRLAGHELAPGRPFPVLRFDELSSLPQGWGLWARVSRGHESWTVWLPRLEANTIDRDRWGRIRPLPSNWRLEVDRQGRGVVLEAARPCTGEVTVPAVVFAERGDARVRSFLELAGSAAPLVAKSDWFRAASAADLWRYLIDGGVYHPESSDHGWRFRCQQCALAWWRYLRAPAGGAPAELLALLAGEVAWSARVALDEDGRWRHGVWCADPETHARFHLDGVSLLLDQGEVSGEPSWTAAADRALAWHLDNLSDTISQGRRWFLHDSLEADGRPTRERPPDLGQSSGNSLALNTHVQALVVLARRCALIEGRASDRFRSAYREGLDALRWILGLDSAAALYRALGAVLRPVAESKGRADLPSRAKRAVFFRLLLPVYWTVRRRFPRLVYPNGFIERDMASSPIADDYLPVNLKDLLELHRMDPRPWLREPIERGVRCLSTFDLEAGMRRSTLFLEAEDVFSAAAELLDPGWRGWVEPARRAALASRGCVPLDAWVAERRAAAGEPAGLLEGSIR